MKNILVVGGSSGIGHQLVKQLTSENQVFATFNTHSLDRSHNLTTFQYSAGEAFNTDLLPDVLDGVVYCPGAIKLKPFHRITTTEFAEDFQLQLMGAVSVLQAVMPKLKLAPQASVVLFSTIAVQTGFPFHSLVASSKGAIEGFTRALAAEWAPKIRVNAIAPSITDTPLASGLLNTPEKREANAQRHPLKTIGTSENIADAVEFLLSEKSAWVTGQVLHVDGGLSALKL